MKDLREQLGLTYILITHNLNIIRFIADRVAVMYLGKLVEVGETATLFTQPKHPYTEALMSAVAIPDPDLREKRQAHRAGGRNSEPAQSTAGLPIPPALLVSAGKVCDGGARPARNRGGRSSGGLPLSGAGGIDGCNERGGVRLIWRRIPC